MSIRFLSTAATALALTATPAIAATEIGGVAAANPLMEGAPDTPTRRALVIGDRVLQNELIATSAAGSGQLLFLDQTTLSIAPSSRIMLDEYVYDPDRSTGKIGMRLTRGALRFIGGRITKLRDAIVGTPAATIGIRGGAAYIEVGENGVTTVIQMAGERTMIVTDAGQVAVTRPSMKVEIAPGEAPRVIGLVSVEEIDARFAAFEGGGGGLTTDLKQAMDGLVTAYGSGELGAPDREPVSTAGERYSGRPIDPERFGLGFTVSPDPEPVDNDGGGTGGGEGGTGGGGTGGGGGGVTESVLSGVSGVAVVAPASGFNSPGGTQVTDPTAQNALLSNTAPDGFTEVRDPERIGVLANGDRYVVPIDEAGGTESFTTGAFPDGMTSGTSDFNSGTGFVSSDFTTDDGRAGVAFFGTATPDQLGAPVSAGAIERRAYDVAPLTGTAFDADFSQSLRGDLVLLEEAGEGYRRENEVAGDSSTYGFAKASQVVLNFEDGGGSATSPGQQSFFSVGTGRIRNSTTGAPLPDLGVFGSVLRNGSTAPINFETNGTLVEFGDGSTVFGTGGENVVFGSGSRFAFDADEDIEPIPVAYDTLDGTTIDPNGFLGAGTLTDKSSIRDIDRLPLGIPSADAVSRNGFLNQGDDTAFTGGYAAGLGVSHLATGMTSDPYILRSEFSTGALFAFDASQNEANASLRMVEGASTAQPGQTGMEGVSDIDTVNYNFGTRSTRSAMATDRDFALRNRTAQDAGFVSGTTNINGNTGRPTPGAGLEQQAFRGALISNAAAGNASDAIYGASIPDDDHEYLRWGWWSGEFRFDPNDTFDFADRRERTHLGTWIAGNRLRESVVGAEQGIARFDGHSVVSIADASGQATRGGSFAMLYDFDNSEGTAEFRDLAGYDFDVPVEGIFTEGGSSQPHYDGVLLNTGAGAGRPAVDVGVSGSFFGDNAANSVRATGGQIDFQSHGDNGAALRASGIFGGDRRP